MNSFNIFKVNTNQISIGIKQYNLLNISLGLLEF